MTYDSINMHQNTQNEINPTSRTACADGGGGSANRRRAEPEPPDWPEGRIHDLPVAPDGGCDETMLIPGRLYKMPGGTIWRWSGRQFEQLGPVAA